MARHNGIASGEELEVSYYGRRGALKFVMTSKRASGLFFLYEVNDGEYKKLGKAKSPVDLEEKYRVNEWLISND